MNYIDKSISKKKLKEFILALIDEGTDPHAFELHRDGKLLIRMGISPYSTKDKRQLFSLSKTFAATALGLAYDRGLVKPSDRMVDIFPEYVPQDPSENLLNMTVHNVMTMNTGHKSCTLPDIARSDDGIRAFFNREVPLVPGTKYAYNSGASYMLNAIVERLTGVSAFDYMYEHFFMPLGIIPQKWQTSGANGINEGGIGLFISSEDVQKLGLVYLNGGTYNGKRILSEEWVRMASSYQVTTVGNGTGNWSAGYGYQIWLNENDGYRGDGAFGQFCTVLPKLNCVFTMLAESTATDKYFGRLLDFAADCFIDDGEEEIDIEGFFENLYAPEYSSEASVCNANAYYKLDENPMGFTRLHAISDGERLDLSFSDGVCIQTISAGNGEWIESNLIAKNVKPVLMQLAVPNRVEHSRIAASYKKSNDGFEIAIRYLNAPHKGIWKISLGDELKIDISYRTAELREDAYCITGSIIR